MYEVHAHISHKLYVSTIKMVYISMGLFISFLISNTVHMYLVDILANPTSIMIKFWGSLLKGKDISHSRLKGVYDTDNPAFVK